LRPRRTTPRIRTFSWPRPTPMPSKAEGTHRQRWWFLGFGRSLFPLLLLWQRLCGSDGSFKHRKASVFSWRFPVRDARPPSVIRASRPSRAFCADARTMHERRRTEIRCAGGRRDGGQIGGPKEPYHRRRKAQDGPTVSSMSCNWQYELPTWGNLTMCVVSHVRRTVKEGIDSLVTNPRSTRHTLVRAPRRKTV
jgi:hypothetical protein